MELALSVSGQSPPLDSWGSSWERTMLCILDLAHRTHRLDQCPQTWVRIGSSTCMGTGKDREEDVYKTQRPSSAINWTA